MSLRVVFARLHASDERDDAYPMRAALPPPTARLTRSWNDLGWWGDQGASPQCVAYAWVHWLEDGPVTHDAPAPIVQPAALYGEAQLIDEWPGTNYDGTSVRAGAKALVKRGLVQSYHWTRAVEDVIQALLEVGPVVVGTNWYSGMLNSDVDDVLRIAGTVLGGHAYVLNGVNLKRGTVRVKNSWGRDWAQDGRALMELETLERLLREDGEACLAVETKTRKAA